MTLALRGGIGSAFESGTLDEILCMIAVGMSRAQQKSGTIALTIGDLGADIRLEVFTPGGLTSTFHGPISGGGDHIIYFIDPDSISAPDIIISVFPDANFASRQDCSFRYVVSSLE